MYLIYTIMSFQKTQKIIFIELEELQEQEKKEKWLTFSVSLIMKTLEEFRVNTGILLLTELKSQK